MIMSRPSWSSSLDSLELISLDGTDSSQSSESESDSDSIRSQSSKSKYGNAYAEQKFDVHQNIKLVYTIRPTVQLILHS